MIDDEIIDKLIPKTLPPNTIEKLTEVELTEPQKRMALWGAFITSAFKNHLTESDNLLEELEYTAFVGIGVSRGRADSRSETLGFDRFAGYQFAIHLLQATIESSSDVSDKGAAPFKRDFVFHIPGTSFYIPIIRSEIVQMRNSGEAYASVAAIVEHKGDNCFLTAGHVVEGKQIGDRLPRMAWDCCDLFVRKTQVGSIDSGLLDIDCSVPCSRYRRKQVIEYVHNQLDRLVTPLPVRAHFGRTSSTIRCSITMTVYPDKSILNSAALAEFFISDHGQKGDSGSLICTDHDVGDAYLRLLGVYCGQSTIEHEDGTREIWGHVLDIKDATRILRATVKGGVFNV